MSWFWKFIMALLCLVFSAFIIPADSGILQAATFDLYANFHTIGITAGIQSSDDPDMNATATVQYRASGESYRAGFNLTRISQISFAGSLFWLDPGTTYDINITFSDSGGVLDGQPVDGSIATRSLPVIPTPVHSLYVSPSGNSSDCSQGSPCALSTALSAVQPGDEIVLMGGTYHEGELTIPVSGLKTAPIVIRSDVGESAILDGGDPGVFSWADEGGGVFSTTVSVSANLVLANGERLFPYQNLSDLQNLKWNQPGGIYVSGNTLYVHLPGDANPSSEEMVISRFNFAFYLEQDYIFFTDLTFRYYGAGEWSKTLYFLDASDNLVQNCKFISNDVGIGIKYDSHRNTFQNNEFSDTIFNWNWDAVKEIGTIEDGGIVAYSPWTGRGTVIRGNTFHDDFDGLHVSPEDIFNQTNETDVYENIAYNMADDGIEIDGYASNVRIWSNTFHDCLMGISLAPCYTGPVYAVRNLMYRTGAGNNEAGPGSAFKFNSGYDPSGTLILLHNTSDGYFPDNNGLTIYEPGEWDLIYARNNIWAGTLYAIENYNTSQPIDLDYDDVYTTQSGELVWWNLPDPEDPHLNTLEEFQQATGMEMNGINAVPGFAAPSQADYTLSEGSTLIDQGLVIPGINDTGPFAYTGSGPDIGAFESGTSSVYGVRIEMPVMVHPSETFRVTGYVDNPGAERTSVPIFFILEVTGAFWFWPDWTYYHPSDSTEVDYDLRDVPSGTLTIDVVSAFTWPDTGSGMSGLHFYGACLTSDMSAIDGKWASKEWGFGP